MLEYSGTLISATTTGSGIASLGLACDKAAWAIHVTGSAGVSAGVVTIESAPTAAYAGTWSSIAVVTVVASATVRTAFETADRHVRARISTTVVDGTVTVTAEAVS